MGCSVCHESGHNARTCKKGSVALAKNHGSLANLEAIKPVTVANGSASGGAGGQTLSKSPMQSKVRNYHTSSSGSVKGRNSSASSSSLTPTPTPQMQILLDRLNNKISEGESRRNEIDLREKKIGEVVSKYKLPKPATKSSVVSIPSAPVPVVLLDHNKREHSKETEDNFCGGCNNHNDHSEGGQCNGGRRCRFCRQPDHNVKTCPLLESQRKEDHERKLRGPVWATDEYLMRMERGPSEKDGPGWIYVYTFHLPKSDDDACMFKIGETMHLPDKRIKVQESNNQETYQKVYSDETPLRKFAEKLIHLQLKEWRRPRPVGDGRTEWFKGERERFIQTVKNVLKEVNFSDWA